ncbi:hypothetical protein [Motiliproteus sp. MSK22-1]|uniref:hypothetical protein n=1 Tax=Motiliproteus sp. MSK22-1 TaxID=1897630 RepID=UPI000978609D|nr:hypothetical protein [Motiliproteus sp. MSK22-1]OMH27151.1 hypothetical protein BGP75_22830 [Motiliproteus sp. MSK22-1]
MFRQAVFVVISLLLLSACGPSHQEVADEYKQRILKKKTEIVAAAKLLQDVLFQKQDQQNQGSLPLCEDTKIPLVFSRYGNSSNTTIAMHQWLLNLDNRSHKIPFNLTSSYQLREALDWSSEPNPQDSIKDEKAEEGFREIFENVLGLEYLVLNQTLDFQEPRMLTVDQYRPGAVSVSMYVLSISPPAVLCQSSFTAETPDKVTSHQFSDFPDLGNANFAIRSSLFDQAREAQLAILKKVSANVK